MFDKLITSTMKSVTRRMFLRSTGILFSSFAFPRSCLKKYHYCSLDKEIHNSQHEIVLDSSLRHLQVTCIGNYGQYVSQRLSKIPFSRISVSYCQNALLAEIGYNNTAFIITGIDGIFNKRIAQQIVRKCKSRGVVTVGIIIDNDYKMPSITDEITTWKKEFSQICDSVTTYISSMYSVY